MKRIIGITFLLGLVAATFQNCSEANLRFPQPKAVLALSSISPPEASQDATVTVTITGKNFDENTAVQVGSSYCTNIQVKSPTELICDVGPVSEVGTVPVKIWNRRGNSSPEKNKFEWVRELSIAEKCQRADYLKTIQIPVAIPAQTGACAFNNGGNGAAVQARAQARVRQDFALNIPTSAAVCNIGFNFPTQNFRYDDDIILTFDDVVLLASHSGQTQNLSMIPGSTYLKTYDWTKVLGTSMNNRTPYCAGQAEGLTTCTIPPSDTQGNFTLNMKPEVFTSILASGTVATNKFSLITIGDNDVAVDCKNSGINFTATVGYVER